MKKIGFIVLALLIGGFANAAVLKIATVAPEGSSWMKDMRASAKEIQELTEGRVQIKYYGGGIMATTPKCSEKFASVTCKGVHSRQLRCRRSILISTCTVCL